MFCQIPKRPSCTMNCWRDDARKAGNGRYIIKVIPLVTVQVGWFGAALPLSVRFGGEAAKTGRNNGCAGAYGPHAGCAGAYGPHAPLVEVPGSVERAPTNRNNLSCLADCSIAILRQL